MKILIVAPFCSLPNEPSFNRFLYLANILSETHDVTLLTSRFRHLDKVKRKTPLPIDSKFEIVLIDEPGYKKNISLARLYSHFVFVQNFIRWFNGKENNINYDIIYSAFPLLETNIFLGSKKKQLGYKLLIDVQDVWPEAISAAIPILKKIPYRFFPFSSKADQAYLAADGLVAVSKTYLSRARSTNKSARNLVIYIGADSERIKKITPHKFDNEKFNFVYIGTISHSYDMETVVHAFNRLAITSSKFCLHIIGDGPGLASLKDIGAENVVFHGYIEYDKMISIAKGCDVLINPIKSNSRASITNKLSDYIFLSKPIINSQTNSEVLDILLNIPSFNYRSGSIKDFIRAVNLSIDNLNIKEKFDVSNDFDRSISYHRLAKFIESFIQK